jgi:hypothetical protein
MVVLVAGLVHVMQVQQAVLVVLDTMVAVVEAVVVHKVRLLLAVTVETD